MYVFLINDRTHGINGIFVSQMEHGQYELGWMMLLYGNARQQHSSAQRDSL